VSATADPLPPPLPLRQRFADWLLGQDARQRIRLVQTGLALLLVLLCVAAMSYAVYVGLARPWPAVGWALASVGGIGGAFVAIRSGWTQHLRDPALTLLQIAWSVGCCAAGYVVAGAMRGAVFPILMVVMMFGMFGLRMREEQVVSAYAVLLIGLTMAGAAWLDPQTFPPRVEFGHFVMVAAMLPTVSLLAARLAWLRRQRSELATALEHVRGLATRDELTGLPNRRHMLQLIDTAERHAARTGTPFSLALVDLDHFKLVNDEHGHATGDEVLRVFSREALAAVRVIDVLGRWGGEEFLLLLSDAGLPVARAAVERLRLRVESLVVFYGSGESLNITLSAGVAEHQAGESTARTLQRADDALYVAKAEGRNRVVAA
jgi:diguanylate cyclase (GGDEF)-like protein